MTQTNFPFSELIMSDEELLQKMLAKPSPQIFSVTDLFDNWECQESIDNSFAYMALAPHHTFIMLTEPVEQMLQYFKSGARQRIRIATVDLGRKLNLKPEIYELYETFEFEWPLQNVWLGVSVGNQTATDHIPLLLMCPATVRFLSCEPLLEAIDIKDYLSADNEEFGHPGIDWVIIGGESGSNSRSCHIDWIRSIVTQCQATNTAVFVKQLGSNAIDSNNYILDVAVNNFRIKLEDPKGADMQEFPEDLQVQDFPA